MPIEWFTVGPVRKSIPALETQANKSVFLRGVGADRLSLDLLDTDATRLGRRAHFVKGVQPGLDRWASRNDRSDLFFEHRLMVLIYGSVDCFNRPTVAIHRNTKSMIPIYWDGSRTTMAFSR